jgi:hypothetical protein
MMNWISDPRLERTVIEIYLSVSRHGERGLGMYVGKVFCSGDQEAISLGEAVDIGRAIAVGKQVAAGGAIAVAGVRKLGCKCRRVRSCSSARDCGVQWEGR